MSKYYWTTLTVPLIVLAGCTSDTKPKDVLAQDTAFAREIAKAQGDTTPVLTDLATGKPAAVARSAGTSTASSSVARTSGSPNSSLVRSATGSAAGAPSRQSAPETRPVYSQRTPAPSRTTSTKVAAATTPPVTRAIPAPPRRTSKTASGANAGTTNESREAAGDGGNYPAPTDAATGSTANRTGSYSSARVIPVGSNISLASNARVCTNTSKVGQTFAATVSESVSGLNGATIPAGSRAQLEITDLKRGMNGSDAPILRFRLVSVAAGGRTYPVDATATSATIAKVRSQPRNRTAQKVLGGAAVGAVVGQILGRDAKSTAAGAAVGAAAGAAAGAASTGSAVNDACLPSGGHINATLNSPAQLSA